MCVCVCVCVCGVCVRVHLQNFLFGSVKCNYMSLFFVARMVFFLFVFVSYQSSVLVIEIIMIGDTCKGPTAQDACCVGPEGGERQRGIHFSQDCGPKKTH